MPVVAVFTAVVVALAAGAVSMGGAAAASHQTARVALQDATSPSWSQDGKQVAFTYLGYTQTSSGLVPSRYRIVRRSSRPGGAVRTVHAGKSSDVFVSTLWAAGGRILFLPSATLYSVGVHGGKPRPVAFPDCRSCAQGFMLSRNGGIAAVTTSRGDGVDGIELVKLKPGREPLVLRTRLAAEESRLGVCDEILAFSPDGRQLVFSRSEFDVPAGGGSDYACGPSVLMSLRLGGGGGGPVPLAQSGIPGASSVPSDAQQVRWSPDGHWAAFVENQNLEVVSTSGAGAPLVLATCFDSRRSGGFSWSPTSKLIAYACTQPDGSGQLMTVRPDGTHPANLLHGRPLTYDSAYHGESEPRWSPDGSRLLFLAHGIDHRTVHVWTIRANGHHLTRLG